MPGPNDDIPELPETSETEDYQAFLDDYSNPSFTADSEILNGHVLSVSDREVIVDIGRKIEGLVPASQFPVNAEGKPAVKAGDTIEVMFDRTGEPVEGYILLSFERAYRRHAWDRLEKAASEGATVTGRVVEKRKGGLAIDIGVIAFLPSSQIEVRPVHNLDPYVGQELEVGILKLNRRRGNVVVSRRVLVEQTLEARKAEALTNIAEGSIVTGVVKNLTDYGAFIDLGGIDGLLHVSDMSYGNVTHPSSVLQVGETVTAKVLKFDRERERISLGMKQLVPDPWTDIETRYAPEARVIGRVVSITDYGAFVELEPGVEGLIHISEMTWSRRMRHPSKVVHPDDQVEAVVLEVKPKDRRISLGIKQLEADPWTTVAERYSIGSVVEGRVRKLADFGAFVEIEDGVDGLVHISDMSWIKRVKHPSEVVKKGQVIQAVILNIDAGNRRLSLGIKQLQPDTWETFFRSHQVGDVVSGKVCRAAQFGYFVELLPGVEGLCHSSEIPGVANRKKGSGSAEEASLNIGDEYQFKIVKMNEAQKRVGLSIRALGQDEERSRLGDYQRQAVAATSTVGEVLRKRNPAEDEQGNHDQG